MLVLFETPAGFALFKVLSEKRLEKVESIQSEFATPERAAEMCVSDGWENVRAPGPRPAPPALAALSRPPQREAQGVPPLPGHGRGA
jgi:hypothetical protein